MRRSRIFVIIAGCCLAAWLGCSGGDEVAGGTEAGNARAAGILYTRAGAPALGAVVRLVSTGSSVIDAELISLDTVDGTGAYAFSVQTEGICTIEGARAGDGRVIIVDIPLVQGTTTPVPDDTLRLTGALQIALPDTFAQEGATVAILGTTYRATVDSAAATAHTILIDSLPEGAIPDVVMASSGQSPEFSTVYVNVAARAGDTVLVDNAFRTESGRNHQAVPGADLQAVIDSLLAGDTLSLAGGTYELQPLTITNRGNAVKPILIRAEPSQVAVLRALSATDNLINLDGAEHVVFDGIEIDSTPLNIDAIKMVEWNVCAYITIRNCVFHNIGSIAVNSQGNHHHIMVSHCHIYDLDSNSAIRVGSLDGAFQPHDWTIEGNWIHDCGTAGLPSASGINAQLNSHRMIFRDNVIYNTGVSGILLHGGYPGLLDTSALSLIEGNVIWNTGEGIGAYDMVTVRNNLLFSCETPLVSYAYGGQVPRYVRIYNNTIHQGDQVNIADWDSVNGCVLANNAVYRLVSGASIPAGATVYGNIGDVTAAGFLAGDAATDLADPASRDFSPRTGSSLIDRAVAPDRAGSDFDGRPRDAAPDVGAYEYSTTGPAWGVTETFKGE